jgi:hypothetical protein
MAKFFLVCEVPTSEELPEGGYTVTLEVRDLRLQGRKLVF